MRVNQLPLSATQITIENTRLEVPTPAAGVSTPLTDSRQDNHLMKAYAEGDSAAFETLYARHKQALYRYLKNGCRNDSLAQELYQDIWLRVIKAGSQYSVQVPFNAWLYQIAHNRLVDHYRQQQPIHQTVELDTDIQGDQISIEIARPLSPEEIAILSQRADLLHSALHKLPEAQREAVLLRHFANMSVKEVAMVLDEGMETVKSRLRYATARLRTILQESS